MGYWDFEEPTWEPSEADDLFDEIKQKLVDSAKSSIKTDIENLRTRNTYLEKRNKELEDRERLVDQKERELEYKSRDIRNAVEREFYKATVEDVFKDALTKSHVWVAESSAHEKPKCNLCDENRQWTVIWPDGSTSSKKCACATPEFWFDPVELIVDQIRYTYQDSNNISRRHYNLTRTYTAIRDNWNDYSYAEFNVSYIFDSFCDDALNTYKKLGFQKCIGFTSKEECQKFCDWLNKRRDGYDY